MDELKKAVAGMHKMSGQKHTDIFASLEVQVGDQIMTMRNNRKATWSQTRDKIVTWKRARKFQLKSFADSVQIMKEWLLKSPVYRRSAPSSSKELATLRGKHIAKVPDLKTIGEFVFAQAKTGVAAGYAQASAKALENGGDLDSVNQRFGEVIQKVGSVAEQMSQQFALVTQKLDSLVAVNEMVNNQSDEVMDAAIEKYLENNEDHVKEAAINQFMEQDDFLSAVVDRLEDDSDEAGRVLEIAKAIKKRKCAKRDGDDFVVSIAGAHSIAAAAAPSPPPDTCRVLRVRGRTAVGEGV